MEIRCADPTDIWMIGQKISGTVSWPQEEELKPRALVVRLCWRTRGEGTEVIERAAEQRIDIPQPVSTGTPVPFELTVPRGPPSWQYGLFAVEWFIEAALDLPWKRDLRAEKTIQVLADGGPPFQGIQVIDLGAQSARTGSWVVWQALVALVPLLFGALFFGAALSSVDARTNDPTTGYAAGSCCTVVSLAMFAFIVRSLVQSRRIGTPEFRVSPPHATPGDRVRFELSLTADRDLVLQTGSVQVRCLESTRRGSGKNSRLRGKVWLDQRVTLQPAPVQLRAHQAALLTAELTLPADAPPSLMIRDHDVVWQAHARLDIKGAPDWVETKRFDVVAPRGSTG